MPQTIWHSKFGKKAGPGDQHPYTVDFDLGGLYPIDGLRDLPRQVGSNGMPKDFEIYISRPADSFDKPIYKGVKEFKFVPLDTGDGPKDDHGDWVDAKLILKGSE